MRYIRTKNGIYENTSTNAYIRCVGVAIVIIKHIDEETLEETLEYRMVRIEDIFKQADTIEELVDCYSYDTETVKDYMVARSWKRADKTRCIYACILTDKGLIYVAKMNEKGELELL